VNRVPQCHACARRNLDTVVTEGEYPHQLTHATSDDCDGPAAASARVMSDLRESRADIEPELSTSTMGRAGELSAAPTMRPCIAGVELRLETALHAVLRRL